MPKPSPALLAGLFLATLATLCLEVLDTRLLSVMAWYHLSFFAVSTAMFGMAAGALHVYLGGERFEGRRAVEALPRHAAWFAIAIPVCHLGNLVVRIPSGITAPSISALAISTLFLAVPFYFAGVVVTIALMRSGVRIGLAYAVDLAGAALGGLLVFPLFAWSNLSTGVVAVGAIAALSAACFARHAGTRAWPFVLLGVALCAGAVTNASAERPLTLWYVKDRYLGSEKFDLERWNVHSRITMPSRTDREPFYWGRGSKAEHTAVEARPIAIDGDALTVMTRWDGDPAGLAWVQHDVTSLPYHLRRGGDVVVLGVGGGRDVLTALWAESRSVLGIELNGITVGLLTGPFRDYAGIANRPEVELVHDEARSHLAQLTRADRRFDVVQMSLIDTWASTAAGGFTLSENGLYTREAFATYLRSLRPGGLCSVSRWYDPAKVSETTRLLSLGVAALLDRGVQAPAQHVVLASASQVATLLMSVDPLGAEDLRRIEEACERSGFQLLIAPGRPIEEPTFRNVLAARDLPGLAAAVADPVYDYSPPSDERPFFFNLLKPSHAFSRAAFDQAGGVLRGNLQATATLVALTLISLVLVLLVIVLPLASTGLPAMDLRSFLLSIAWFAAIGFGFMLVQIGFMQRFSVYLGHPAYAVIAVLATMILAAGAGSLASDRVRVEERGAASARVALAAAAVIALAALALRPLVAQTAHFGTAGRVAITVAIVGGVAFALGFCFPTGMRLVRRISSTADAWMWGVNGATGVLGAAAAVAIAMWLGISANLWLAAALYTTLALVGPALARRARA
ncbi:MAG: hypothetical protein JNK02_06015 [Planctomycetes bacterium]|nr:hypothetical protein [Planctomycetota bacterium]